MSATYRCDLCKDLDLNATHTLHPNFPVRRYVPGGVIAYSNDPSMYVEGVQNTTVGYAYDLCESCRIEYTELVEKFLGRK